jgi:recombination associated protein RdgC
MLFKNLLVHRLGKKWSLTAEQLEEKLAKQALQPCGSYAMESRGWLNPREEDERYVYNQHRHWLIALGVEQKLLPSSVIKQAAKDLAAQISAQQGRPVGRKEMRDLKDRVTNELMPRALAKRSTTRAWLDEVNRLLIIEAGADKKAEEFLEALRRAEEDFPCRRLETKLSAGPAMTRWLSAHQPPRGFSIDQDLELQAADMSKATVRYTRHDLEGKDIRDHIAAGKTVMRMGMTWKDRVSFVLTEQLQITRVSFVDIVRDEAGGDAADAEEQFAIDFALMTGELSQMIAALVEALDGEKTADEA